MLSSLVSPHSYDEPGNDAVIATLCGLRGIAHQSSWIKVGSNVGTVQPWTCTAKRGQQDLTNHKNIYVDLGYDVAKKEVREAISNKNTMSTSKPWIS